MAHTSATRTSEIRIVVFGKSQQEQTLLCSFIRGQREVSQSMTKKAVLRSEWEKIPLSVVKMKDVYSLPNEKLKHEIKKCVAQCSPGPNILLLLVTPSDFTGDNSRTVRFILGLLGPEASSCTMIIMTEKYRGGNPSVDQLLQECGQKQHTVNFNDKDFAQTQLQPLMEKVEMFVSRNKGQSLNYREEEVVLEPPSKPSLNLILCGGFQAGKSAVAANLLEVDKPLKANIRYEGELWGHRVSLAELPPTHSKSPNEVMKEMLQCVSQFPEGVDAFVLVFPLGTLTDDNKEELKILQQRATSDFTMILFFTELSPSDPSVQIYMQAKEEIKELCQSFKDRHAILNLADEQQTLELLNIIKRMKADRPEGFKKEKMIRPRGKSNACMFRMALIGKTGSGKSATANTILERKEFISKSGMQAVTAECQKAEVTIDGRQISVVDTPGLFDPTRSNEDVQRELVRCVNFLAPGPHVFLLVLRIDRFTKEEQETVSLLQMFFGENAKDFTIVVFTRGDELAEGQTIEQCIEEDRDGRIKNLVAECGGRYHVMDNKDQKNRDQVRQLVRKVELLVEENRGNWYISRMFKEAEEAIQEEMEIILRDKEEDIARKENDLKRQHDELMKVTIERLKKEHEQVVKKSEAEETRRYPEISQQQIRQKGPVSEEQPGERESKILKTMQDNFEKEMHELRKTNHQQARKQAEEMNDFRSRYSTDFLSLMVKHGREVEDLREKQQRSRDILIQQLCMKKSYKKDYKQLKRRQEEEINNVTVLHSPEDVDYEVMKKQHNEELEYWVDEHVRKTTQKDCTIL